MEINLGTCSLRRTGLNTLKGTIHPKHGFLWTDGKSVYVSKLPTKEEIESRSETGLSDPRRISVGKELEVVHYTSWSSSGRNPTYVSVVSQDIKDSRYYLTLWKVYHSRNILQFDWVVLHHLESQPLPQGCLWNPCEDLICIANRDVVAIYSRHRCLVELNRTDSLDKNTTVAWDSSGVCLVVSTESKLMFYKFNLYNLTLELQHFLDVGRISVVERLENNSFLCAEELPLGSLLRVYSSASEDDGLPLPVEQGALETLMNVREATTAPLQASSRLVLVSWDSASEQAQIIDTYPLQNLLTPDILTCYGSPATFETAVIGSNSSSVLQVFRILENQLQKVAHLPLNPKERPKGVTFYDGAVWRMVGTPVMEHGFSVPEAGHVEYQVVVQRVVDGFMHAKAVDGLPPDSVKLPKSGDEPGLLRAVGFPLGGKLSEHVAPEFSVLRRSPLDDVTLYTKMSSLFQDKVQSRTDAVFRERQTDGLTVGTGEYRVMSQFDGGHGVPTWERSPKQLNTSVGPHFSGHGKEAENCQHCHNQKVPLCCATLLTNPGSNPTESCHVNTADKPKDGHHSKGVRFMHHPCCTLSIYCEDGTATSASTSDQKHIQHEDAGPTRKPMQEFEAQARGMAKSPLPPLDRFAILESYFQETSTRHLEALQSIRVELMTTRRLLTSVLLNAAPQGARSDILQTGDKGDLQDQMRLLQHTVLKQSEQIDQMYVMLRNIMDRVNVRHNV